MAATPLRIRLPFSCTSLSPTPQQTTKARVSQTLTLPDGRTLGYAEYGHPTGSPLMFFHGFPSSRLEGWGLESLALRRGLRIITPDRPGYGLSTFQPNRRITDWPADVLALTTHLGLSKVALLGGSGGGPYALACAHSLPAEMFSGVGVLAGAPPWSAGTHHLSLSRRLAAVAASYAPSATAGVVNGLVGLTRWCASTGPVTRWLDDWLQKQEGEETQPEGERERLSLGERREKLLGILFEAFVQGSAGTVQEAELLSRDWGFAFEDVRYDKVLIWHGAKDANAPIQMIRYMAERLPYCVLREFDETHFTLSRHLEGMITQLVPEAS